MYIVAMYTFRWWDDCHAICLDVFSFSCNLFCLMNSFHFICFLPPSPFPLFLPRTTSTTTTTTHSPTLQLSNSTSNTFDFTSNSTITATTTTTTTSSKTPSNGDSFNQSTASWRINWILKNDEIKEKGGTKKPTNKLIKSQKQTKKDKITTTKKKGQKKTTKTTQS